MSSLGGTTESSEVNRAPTASPAPQAGRHIAWRSALGFAAAAVALATVFVAYLDPHFMRDLADFMWQCF